MCLDFKIKINFICKVLDKKGLTKEQFVEDIQSGFRLVIVGGTIVMCASLPTPSAQSSARTSIRPTLTPAHPTRGLAGSYRG